MQEDEDDLSNSVNDDLKSDVGVVGDQDGDERRLLLDECGSLDDTKVAANTNTNAAAAAAAATTATVTTDIEI